MFKHYPLFLECSGLELEASDIQLRSSPQWLGGFGFRIYGMYGGRNYGRTPKLLRRQAERMKQLVPDQFFTTLFLQRYKQDEQVLPHRDPRNNVGYTIISTFGTWTGATTHIQGQEPVQMQAGSTMVLPCTINGKQGPRHWVTPVTSGTRYALILNTIQ